jgi:hypothetical protein
MFVVYVYMGHCFIIVGWRLHNDAQADRFLYVVHKA